MIATSAEELQDLIQRLIRAGRKYGLEINRGKTKVMATDGQKIDIYVEGSVLKQVDRFQYLGLQSQQMGNVKKI